LQAIKDDYLLQAPRPKSKKCRPRRLKRPKKLCLCCYDDYECLVCEKCAKRFECKNALEGHFVAHLEAMSRRSPAGAEEVSRDSDDVEDAPSSPLLNETDNYLKCDICQLICPNFDSLKLHWHTGKCLGCGRGMRCATEVHHHYKTCIKNNIMETLLMKMLDLKGHVQVLNELLKVKCASEIEAPAAQEMSVDVDETQASAPTLDAKVYFIKQETVLVPESDYLNNAVTTNLVADDMSLPQAVKVEPFN
jgi:hypothetical protein